MHSPDSTQALAHLREASGPSPERTMSSTPAIVACGSAPATPAAPVIGQASKHLPHLVQASSMASTRAVRAVSKALLITAFYALRRERRNDAADVASNGHSALMPANLITLAHFSVSLAMSLPKSAGEPVSPVLPSSARRSLILGSASAALISLLSLSMTSVGVLLGAPTPKKLLAS